MSKRLGLLTCSAVKLAVPAPAWLLYSISCRFSQHFQFLKKHCDCIRIVSAGYGLLDPQQVIVPYDFTVSAMPANLRVLWTTSVRDAVIQTGIKDILSLLSTSYAECLHGLPADFAIVNAAEGDLLQTAKLIGKQGTLKRSSIQECWPLDWLLCLIHKEGPITLEKLAAQLRARGYHERTVQAQLYRVRKCPLHEQQGNRIRHRYPAPMGLLWDPHSQANLTE